VADRLIDRVLDPQYVAGLADVDDDELARRLEDASEVERQVSAQRRSLHRIIDELQTELAQRASS
jgi:hypothetical protein